MPASLAIALVAVLAVGGPVVAYLVRSGAIQKWPRRYYESDVDDRVRNGIYGILPLSAMAALALLGIAAASRGGRWEYVTLACTLAGLASLLWSRRWIKHPPEWLQPEWRLAAERGQAMPNERTLQPRSRGKLEVGRAQYWLGWAGLLAIVVLSVVFGFSAGTFIAIGVALTYLLATRPKRLEDSVENWRTRLGPGLRDPPRRPKRIVVIVDAMLTRRRPRYLAAVLAAMVTVAAGAAEIAGSSDPHADLILFVLAVAVGATAGAIVAWLGRRGVGGTSTAECKWRWAVLIGPLTVPIWGAHSVRLGEPGSSVRLARCSPSCSSPLPARRQARARLLGARRDSRQVIAAIEWQPIVGLLGGVGMIVLGIASSRGSFRRWEPWYRDPAMP